MPRNAGGAFTLPAGTLGTSGTTIQSSKYNAAVSDIASEMTDSLSRSGRGGMAANLAMGGNKITDLAEGTSDNDAVRVAEFSGLVDDLGNAAYRDVGTAANQVAVGNHTHRLYSPGMIVPYAGTSVPDPWLMCFGQAVSRTTYADLFTAIGTTYGAGDASTTFNLPDLRGRVIAGQDDMGGSSANRLTGLSGGIDGDVLGGSGGEQTHTLTSAESLVALPLKKYTGSGGDAVNTTQLTDTARATAGVVTGTTTTDSLNLGGGGTHNNVQPTLILNYIIYAGPDPEATGGDAGGVAGPTVAVDGHIAVFDGGPTAIKDGGAFNWSNLQDKPKTMLSGIIAGPSNSTYIIALNVPVGYVVTKTTTICDTGTCTAEFAINGTPLGGSSNSVSSSQNEQTHVTANTVAAGDDISMAITSNANCVRLTFTVELQQV